MKDFSQGLTYFPSKVTATSTVQALVLKDEIKDFLGEAAAAGKLPSISIIVSAVSANARVRTVAKEIEPPAAVDLHPLNTGLNNAIMIPNLHPDTILYFESTGGTDILVDIGIQRG